MFDSFTSMMPFMIPVVSVIAVFTFAAVAAYSGDRRKEREAFYRHELHKKLAEQGGGSATQIADLVREEHEVERERQREGLKIGGIITAAAGGGIMAAFQFIGEEDVWMIGYIPLFIGLAMLVYALFLFPRRRPAKPGPMV